MAGSTFTSPAFTFEIAGVRGMHRNGPVEIMPICDPSGTLFTILESTAACWAAPTASGMTVTGGGGVTLQAGAAIDASRPAAERAHTLRTEAPDCSPADLIFRAPPRYASD